ncbi:MAG TPA: LapA family protein, partial [Candidatus Saccharimonadales bacterium]|nr:LapA family protein [Candidatus Saccharimonadales bacterium]
MPTSIWGAIWRNVSSRIRKHLFYHLIIPLAGGILVEGVVHKLIDHNGDWGLFVFRALTLIVGVLLSWLLVMFLLITHETKKKLSRRNLKKLEKRLKTATGYYGVSIIDLADWFEPGSQLYLAKLLKRKLAVDNFEHDRTLLFFSNRELENTKVDLTDEHHYAKCLAFIHQDFDIPLSFLDRKQIFQVLKDLDEEDRLRLGCYPRWTTWRPFHKFQRLRLNWLRWRIPQLDFGLVTSNNGDPSV